MKRYIRSSDSHQDLTYQEILDRYLPESGEGRNRAQQVVTAMNALVSKFYDDGDVFDNTSNEFVCTADLSDVANWLYEHIPVAKSILDKVYNCYFKYDYSRLLAELSDVLLYPDYLRVLSQEPTTGSIYHCSGPYVVVVESDDDAYFGDVV